MTGGATTGMTGKYTNTSFYSFPSSMQEVFSAALLAGGASCWFVFKISPVYWNLTAKIQRSVFYFIMEGKQNFHGLYHGYMLD